MHYSKAQKISELIPWSHKIAKYIHENFKNVNDDEIPVLIYSGMSGTALATALACAYYNVSGGKTIHMMYVRKDSELNDCHGDKLECETLGRFHETGYNIHAIFVDDFVSSGATFKRCFNALKFKEKSSWGWAPPVNKVLTISLATERYASGLTSFANRKEHGEEASSAMVAFVKEFFPDVEDFY